LPAVPFNIPHFVRSLVTVASQLLTERGTVMSEFPLVQDQYRRKSSI
jgi:hypothetical protein